MTRSPIPSGSGSDSRSTCASLRSAGWTWPRTIASGRGAVFRLLPEVGRGKVDIRGMAEEDDPQRDLEPGQSPGGRQEPGDDPHGLLCIVAAVAEAVEGGGEKLQPPSTWSTRVCPRDQLGPLCGPLA